MHLFSFFFLFFFNYSTWAEVVSRVPAIKSWHDVACEINHDQSHLRRVFVLPVTTKKRVRSRSLSLSLSLAPLRIGMHYTKPGITAIYTRIPPPCVSLILVPRWHRINIRGHWFIHRVIILGRWFKSRLYLQWFIRAIKPPALIPLYIHIFPLLRCKKITRTRIIIIILATKLIISKIS